MKKVRISRSLAEFELSVAFHPLSKAFYLLFYPVYNEVNLAASKRGGFPCTFPSFGWSRLTDQNKPKIPNSVENLVEKSNDN